MSGAVDSRGEELRLAAPARRTRRSRSTLLLLMPATAWVVVGVVCPLAFVVWVSFWAPAANPEPGVSTEAWRQVLGSASYRGLVGQTLKVTAIVLVLVGFIGFTAGYFLARFVPSKKLQALLLMMAILPFWTSYIIRIITWQPLFGQRGVVNWVLLEVGLTSKPLEALLFNQTAMIVAMTSLYVVFVVGPVYWALSRIDDEVIAASRSLGAGAWRTFWKVEFPLAKGGLVAGLFFAAVFLLGEYATERLIGGGTKPGLAGAITSVTGSGQWPVAAALAVVLLVIAAAVLGSLMKVHDLQREL